MCLPFIYSIHNKRYYINNQQINQQTNQQTFSGSPNYYPGARYDFATGLWYGPNIRQQPDTESAQQGVGNAASGINSRFK